MKKQFAEMTFVKFIVALLCPFIICLLYCGIRKISFFNLYIPNSYNNDVLFYYKQVEGIVCGGIPKGYFGYNESHALIGSFATWNPLLFIPWILFGLVFGVGDMSLIVCNIVVFSLALAFFVLLVNPKWKSIITIIVLFMLFPSFSIHLMNGLVETTIAALLLLYWGFAIRYSTQNLNRYITGMFVISFLLTSCRPFTVVLTLLPAFYLIRKKHVFGTIISLLLVGDSVTSYFAFNRFFASPYFGGDLLNFNIVTLLLHGRFKEAYDAVFPILRELYHVLKEAFIYGLTAGAQYVVAIVASLGIFLSLFKKGSKEKLPYKITYLLTVAGILVATVIIGNKVNEGGRHLWAFAILGIVLISVNESKMISYIFSATLVLILAVMIARGAMVPTDYDIPAANPVLSESIEKLKADFADNNVKSTGQLSWDNTIIWAVDVSHYELYSLPSGFGINLCLKNYIINNFDNLHAKYLAVVKDGDLDEMCKEKNYTVVAFSDKTIVYSIR